MREESNQQIYDLLVEINERLDRIEEKLKETNQKVDHLTTDVFRFRLEMSDPTPKK